MVCYAQLHLLTTGKNFDLGIASVSREQHLGTRTIKDHNHPKSPRKIKGTRAHTNQHSACTNSTKPTSR